jgi:hypothetical protein
MATTCRLQNHGRHCHISIDARGEEEWAGEKTVKSPTPPPTPKPPSPPPPTRAQVAGAVSETTEPAGRTRCTHVTAFPCRALTSGTLIAGSGARHPWPRARLGSRRARSAPNAAVPSRKQSCGARRAVCCGPDAESPRATKRAVPATEATRADRACRARGTCKAVSTTRGRWWHNEGGIAGKREHDC